MLYLTISRARFTVFPDFERSQAASDPKAAPITSYGASSSGDGAASRLLLGGKGRNPSYSSSYSSSSKAGAGGGGGGGGGDSSSWNYGAHPSLPRSKRGYRLRATRRVCAGACALLVLLPSVVFLSALLPDEFTEINHWAIQHYEATSQSNSQVRPPLAASLFFLWGKTQVVA